MLKIAAISLALLTATAGIAAACGGSYGPPPKVAECITAHSADVDDKAKKGLVRVSAFYPRSSLNKFRSGLYVQDFSLASWQADSARAQVEYLRKHRKPIVFSFIRFEGSKSWHLSVDSVRDYRCKVQ